MIESTIRKLVEVTFGKEDSKGLKGLLASLRNRIQTHDAQRAANQPAIAPALASAPSAPAASRAPPSSRPPNPHPLDSRTNSGQGHQANLAPSAPAPKRRRTTSHGEGCRFLQQFRQL